eukprot:gnl/TRDRNA2_/TRDRNA2_136568_c0_seq4.p1 gnl/TRDRNA2_/TRDRNA2_136568_c0~~gnl/TRDRNA2_/TRDRNA2_136568_c0_seq4.p1  ORF type:complete len:208 (-),score=32.60 gnl/TRDRNA2_/TRDRNA2_136568_c0_seq4:62-685(-)
MVAGTANLYDVLGVHHEATLNDIKKAYHKLALEHHPDRGGDAQKFQEYNHAYQVLADADKRALYDAQLRRLRHPPPNSKAQGRPSSAAARSSSKGTPARKVSAPLFVPPADPIRCPKGHVLKFMGLRDTGWACDGDKQPGGCKGGIRRFHESANMPDYRCDECNWDLCEHCYKALQAAPKKPLSVRPSRQHRLDALQGDQGDILPPE